MTVRNKIALVAAAVAFMLTLGTTCALADVTYDIGTGNAAISGFTGPYASVDVHWIDSTHATITFTSDTASGCGGTCLYLMGDGGTAAVNVNATTWTLGSLTGTNYFADSKYALSNGGAGNEDGFGGFNQTIDSFDGYGDTSSTVSFALTNTSGTWADASSVLKANAPVAAHIFVCGESGGVCLSSAGALTTGFGAGVGTGGTFSNFEITPEPASIALLGGVLVGLASILRKKKTPRNVS